MMLRNLLNPCPHGDEEAMLVDIGRESQEIINAVDYIGMVQHTNRQTCHTYIVGNFSETLSPSTLQEMGCKCVNLVCKCVKAQTLLLKPSAVGVC